MTEERAKELLGCSWLGRSVIFSNPEGHNQYTNAGDAIAKLHEVYAKAHLPETSYDDIDRVTESLKSMTGMQVKEIAVSFLGAHAKGFGKQKAIDEINRKITEMKSSAVRISSIGLPTE